jgi:hypothetical protein
VTRLPTGHGPPPWSSHVDRLSLRVRTLRCRSSRWRGG